MDISPVLQAFEGSAIVQNFTVEEGEPNITVVWNFLTNDSNSDFLFTPGSPRDYAFVVLDGQIITTLADTSSSLISSSTAFNQETGFQEFTLPALSPGVHTLGLGLVDVQDNAVTSALLVDIVEDIPPIDPETPATIPEPTSKLGLFLFMTFGLVSFAKRRL